MFEILSDNIVRYLVALRLDLFSIFRIKIIPSAGKNDDEAFSLLVITSLWMIKAKMVFSQKEYLELV